jgi:hypothetical protein
MHHRLIRCAFTFICIAAPLVGYADGETAEAIRKRWEKLYQDRAKSLSVAFVDSAQRTVRIVPQPVMSYSNPVRNAQQHGNVFLWTESGRPVLMAAYWSVSEPNQPGVRRLSREWHSLTADNITVKRDARTIWTSKEPGIEWKPLENTPGPVGSRPLRLTQMRKVARRLHAEIETAEGELRLMPQPIYRYPKNSGVVDGAVFAFVMGTDPELLAVIEARAAAGGATEWHLGFVHFTNARVTADFDDQQIYQAERWSPRTSGGRHHLGIAVELHPADLVE